LWFALAAAGHTLAGAFRLHVSCLAGFLNSIEIRTEMETRLIETAVKAA
jgi:hypothetical protein